MHTPDDLAADLLRYIDASPTPHHAVAETERRLRDAGYVRLDERAPITGVRPGARVYFVRGGASLAAFHVGSRPPSDAGMRFIGAHTDSPALRVRPSPDRSEARCALVGVEPYGGVLLHTWLDRDLSIAGRVLVEGTGGAIEARLVRVDRPLLRVPSLAIHLDRTVNTEGLKLNPQKHMVPVVALEPPSAGGKLERFHLRGLLSTELGTTPDAILGWDLLLYDVQPAARLGASGELISAPRLDNLASCHAGLHALRSSGAAPEATRALVLYDHEEVGSRTARGAASSFLRTLLDRLVRALEPNTADALDRALAGSVFVSADMAHALHPNYTDRHEPDHAPLLGRGPVLKSNANQAYATDGEGWARFESWARRAGVRTQRFVSRSDQSCGTTIGPITAAGLGIATVDVGNPMLSMHSCRELAAAADVAPMVALMRAFYES
ncbi:MAG: M18 family aminopeptidase [Myxococcales bacterium]|nr:M18 family aminopeptidase [Myxococcales bacterium]